MSDLIKREDAIDAIGADIDEIDALDPSAGIKKACIRRAIWKVMGVPSADRPQEWIPCSERLPSNFNEDEAVLATTDVDGRRVMLMPAVDVERFYLKGYVSAWMPSPQPWEGADDEDNH